MVDTNLKKLRTRWTRWHGQMMRQDRFTFTELFDCNYQGWRREVSERLGKDTDFRTCIQNANSDELKKLDMIVLDMKTDNQ